MNDLGFEEADHRFGERVVIAIADAADRGLDPGLGETLGVANADMLRPRSEWQIGRSPSKE